MGGQEGWARRGLGQGREGGGREDDEIVAGRTNT